MKATQDPIFQTKIYSKDGLRMVEIIQTPGQVSARLYLAANNPDPIKTATGWNGKTVKGAIRWAGKTLGYRNWRAGSRLAFS